jgi:hypothetical protein
MLISNENIEIRNRLSDFDKRIEDMHLEFYKYYTGEERKLPDMQKFEREILIFSRKKIIDLELSKNLDRLLFKFQNRKKVWLSWVEETRHKPKKEE